MFTGIIEATAELRTMRHSDANLILSLYSDIADSFRVDESVCHNGVCLTVENVDFATRLYQATAIEETLQRSMLGDLKIGDRLNLERSLRVDARLDGHFVQGHVDAVGVVRQVADRRGSFEIWIEYPRQYQELVVEKGSIAINGVSLTIAHLDDDEARLAVDIIPHTWQKTNAASWQAGRRVNLEFDVLGKYAARQIRVASARV